MLILSMLIFGGVERGQGEGIIALENSCKLPVHKMQDADNIPSRAMYKPGIRT